MTAIRIFACAVVVLAAAGWAPVDAQTINPKPSDQTVTVNSNVLFVCGPAISGDTVTWTFISSQSGTPNPQKLVNIINMQPSYIPGVSNVKYLINNTYSLFVTNVQLTDGGTYMCESTSASTDVTANLVVIGSLTPSLTNLPYGYSPYTPLMIGQSLSVNCTLNYGAPNGSLYPIVYSQNPQLSITIGGNVLPSTSSIVSIGHMVALANITIVQSYVGQVVVCQMLSGPYNSPLLRVFSNLTLPIPFAPTQIAINTTTTPVFSDYVNCSALGYPIPTVKWVPLNPYNAVNPQSGYYGVGMTYGWAVLSFATNQTASWNCTAYNGQGGQQINMTYTFAVTNSQGQSVATTSSASKLASGTVFALFCSVLMHLLQKLF